MSNIQLEEKQQTTTLNQLLQTVKTGFSKANSSESLLVPELKLQLQGIRDYAENWAQELEIPTRRDEEWRFTDLSPLLQYNFETANSVTLDEQAITSLSILEAEQSRLVFVNGFYTPDLSSTAALPDGVFVGNLAHLPEKLREKIPHYLAKQQGNQEVFTTLNTAGLTDVAVIWVSKNQVIETPIHLLFISTLGNTPSMSQLRGLVVAETGSSVSLIEHYATLEFFACSDQVKGHPYFSNSVTEIWLEENAEVKHTRLQRDASSAFHIGRTAVSQSRNSRYTCNAISLGAKISRHNLDVYQTGEGTETYLNGLTLIGNEQLADTHSSMMLNHPHGTVAQVHKCIIDDKARAVFNGKVFVPQAAQFANASQLNRNLLLSSKGRVDTKPQLEIVADNVKCSHGATVSQLEEDEVFYLRSRGLSEQASRHLLIDGFAAEILSHLPSESLQKNLSRCVSCRTDLV